jgi:thymidylate kinase
MAEEASAVVITGVFGSGKSSVAAEIADILERRRAPYALVDLDYLTWFDTGEDEWPGRRVYLENLRAVVGNYLAVGVRFFIVAGSILDENELDELKGELDMPVTVVRLTVPIEAIEERLRADVTSGRKDDLRTAREWITARTGEGFEDWVIANDRPIQVVARDVLSRLGRWFA